MALINWGNTGKTEKPKKAEKPKKPAGKKQAGGKKPASRGELIAALQQAELDSIRPGKDLPGIDSQIWFNPKKGEIWITHFSPSDNYLPGPAAENFVLLWETLPKTLDEVLGLQAAQKIDGQETEYFLRQLSEYVRGKFSHKFNPAAIADRLIEQKIKPAIERLAPVKEKAQGTKKPAGGENSTGAGDIEPVPESAGAPGDIEPEAVNEQAPVDQGPVNEPVPVEKLWDAVFSFIEFIDGILPAGEFSEQAGVVLEQYAPAGGGWRDIPRGDLFEVLAAMKKIYQEWSEF